MDDRVDCQQYVRRTVYDGGGVAGPDADGRFAGRICCRYHSGAAGGKDQVSLFHYVVRHFKAGNVDPGDYAFRSSGPDRGFVNDPGCLDSALLCSWMRAYKDTVPRFECDECLEYCCGGRVRCRYDCRQDTDRLGDLFDAVCLVFLNDAASLHVFVCIVYILWCVMVLDDLI